MSEEQGHSQRSSTTEIFQRVRGVEAEIGGIKSELSAMAAILTNQGNVLARISLNIEQKSSTDWKALASWASVVIVVIGLFSTLALNPVKERQANQEQTIERIVDARATDAQNRIQDAEQRGRYRERVDQLRDRFERLEDQARPNSPTSP